MGEKNANGQWRNATPALIRLKPDGVGMIWRSRHDLNIRHTVQETRRSHILLVFILCHRRNHPVSKGGDSCFLPLMRAPHQIVAIGPGHRDVEEAYQTAGL